MFRDQLVVLVVAALVFFTNLGVPQLWDEDEPRNAACAREMLERGDWVVPTFNYELRTQKPVLLYWCMLASYSVFGVNELAARLPSAIFAIGTSVLTYHLGRLLFNRRVGLFAGLAIATCLMFGVAGRAATPDSSLVFFVTLSLTAFVWGVARRRSEAFSLDSLRQLPAQGGLNEFVPRHWWQFAIAYTALGLSLLAKGPVGVALPIAIVGLFLMLVRRSPEASLGTTLGQRASNWITRFAHAAWALRPLTLSAIVLAVALPWYVLVGVRTGGVWPREFFGTENLSRFRSPMENHGGPFIYYVPAILVGLFPWSIVLPAAAWIAVRKSLADRPRSPAYLFVTCWAGVWLAVFSLAGTKLPSYVLPAYPALALICAAFVNDWLVRPASVPAWLMHTAWGSLALVGIALLVGLPFAANSYLPGDEAIALVGLIPLLGGLACIYWFTKRQPLRVIVALCVTAVLFSISLFGGVAVLVNRHQNSASLVELARGSTTDGKVELATLAHAESSVVYYAREPVARCGDPDEAARFLSAHRNGFLITNDEQFALLKHKLPVGVTVVARQPRFLKGGEVLLLGHQAHTARTGAAQLR